MRDGSSREGNVRSCDEDHCSVDGERIPIAAISRIEFRKVTTPPAVPPNAVVTVDGTIVAGSFTGLNRGYVYAGDEEIDRDKVAVIFIVPPPPPAPDPEPAPIVQPGATPPPPPQSEPQTSRPAPSPQPAPVPQSATRPASQRRTSQPSSGATWNGRLRGVVWGNVDGCRNRLTFDVMVRFRETKIRPLPQDDGTIIGTATDLDPTGSTVSNRYSAVCTGGSERGRGTITISGEDARGGIIYRNTKATPRRVAGYGLELLPGQEWYSFTIAMASGPDFETTVRNVSGTFPAKSDFMFPVVGGSPIAPRSPMADPVSRFVQAGRMSGSYVVAAGGAFEKLAVQWMICRSGVVCSRLPPLPDEAQQQRCPQEALAELCGDQLVGLVEALEPMQEEYARLTNEADKYYDDYQTALRRCIAWKVVQEILETILGAQTAHLGQAGENAKHALDLFKALIEGDPSAPFGAAITGDAEAMFYPLELANKIKGYLEEGNKIGSVLAQAGDLNSLRGVAVDACLGSVSPELHMRAQKFVDLTRQAAEYYRDVYAPKMNDLNNKLRECEERDAEADRFCQ